MLRNRRFSAIASLFMFLLVVAGGGMDGSVLCITSDGQVALEKLTGTCCDGNARPAFNAYANPSTQGAARTADHHCDTCVDIPITNHELVRHQTSGVSAKLRVANFAVSSFMEDGFRRTAKAGLSSLPPPAAKTTLASLRTVSLLI